MANKVETVATTAGKLKKVTLEEFIESIPVEKLDQLIAQYNTQIDYGQSDTSAVPSGQLPEEEDSTYVRNFVILGENSLHQQLLHILNQVDFFSAPTGMVSQIDQIEAAAVHCMENFGTPTHLVEITPGCMAMFCKDDFRYKLMGPTKGAIVCYFPRRNIIFRARW